MRARLWDDGTLELDTRLSRTERSAALTHELEHDTRGIYFDEDTPDALVAKEEGYVEAAVAMKLVPWAELEPLIVRAVSDEQAEPLTARSIAMEFDTTDAVADRALRMAQHRIAAPNHPRWREWM